MLQCGDDADCVVEGEVCCEALNNVCTPERRCVEMPSACRVNEDCAEGQECCDNNVCAARGACEEPQPLNCNSDDDCDVDGQVCCPERGNVCVFDRLCDNVVDCVNDDECSDGEVCCERLGNTCAPQRACR